MLTIDLCWLLEGRNILIEEKKLWEDRQFSEKMREKSREKSTNFLSG